MGWQGAVLGVSATLGCRRQSLGVMITQSLSENLHHSLNNFGACLVVDNLYFYNYIIAEV